MEVVNQDGYTYAVKADQKGCVKMHRLFKPPAREPDGEPVKFCKVFELKGKEKTVTVNALYDETSGLIYEIGDFKEPKNHKFTGEQYTIRNDGEVLDAVYDDRERDYYAQNGQKGEFSVVRKYCNIGDVTLYSTTRSNMGNPRYIVHYLSLGLKSNESTKETCKAGFSPYRGKGFSGGFVFESYSVKEDFPRMLEILKGEK